MTVKRRYWDNGQLQYKYPYQDGKLHGVTRYWYENGQLYSEIPYQEGKLHGVAKYWHDTGALADTSYYLYSNQVTQEDYRHHNLVEKLAGL